MASKYTVFDRSRLRLRPLAERAHELQLDHWLALDDAPLAYAHPQLADVAARIIAARQAGAARILVMGAHVLRAGVNRQIIDLLERGLLDHIAHYPLMEGFPGQGHRVGVFKSRCPQIQVDRRADQDQQNCQGWQNMR